MQRQEGEGGVGALSQSPGLMEAARFLHPGAGRSRRPPHRLHPLLPDPRGNLEEPGHVRVTHGFTLGRES